MGRHRRRGLWRACRGDVGSLSGGLLKRVGSFTRDAKASTSLFPLHAPGVVGGRFSVGELALDQVKAGVPEAGVGEIDADYPTEVLG